MIHCNEYATETWLSRHQPWKPCTNLPPWLFQVALIIRQRIDGALICMLSKATKIQRYQTNIVEGQQLLACYATCVQERVQIKLMIIMNCKYIGIHLIVKVNRYITRYEIKNRIVK